MKGELLEAASALLVEGGPDALRARAVAERAQTSTMAIYSHFGGMDGLWDAMYREGFEVLHRAQRAVRTPQGRRRVAALCRAYRRVALGYPGHYAVMTATTRSFTPSAASLVAARSTFEVLVEAVVAASDRPPPDAEAIAHVVFATCHGMISLELAGLAPPGGAAKRYDLAVGAVLTGFALEA